MNLVGAGEFVGNVYAPSSLVTAPGYVDVYQLDLLEGLQDPRVRRFPLRLTAITQVGDNRCHSRPDPRSVHPVRRNAPMVWHVWRARAVRSASRTPTALRASQLVCSMGNAATLGAPK